MEKNKKIWLWLGLALFAIPEILWSSISNQVYQYSQTGVAGGTHPYRTNWLTDSAHINVLSIILFLQFLGLVLLTVFLFGRPGKAKWFGVISLFVSIIVLLLFGLSLSIRSLGL